jgi:Flp pilus assembly protein TadB
MLDRSGPPRPNIPGLVAASIWAVGLAVGVVALATGHAGAAVVALLLAVVAPWFGLAWVSRGQRRAFNVALFLHGSRADGAAAQAKASIGC